MKKTTHSNHGPTTLAEYIRSLDGFSLEGTPAGNYGHMGSTLTEIVLQARMNYRNVVLPRVRRVLNNYPQAKTVSGFLGVVHHDGPESVLQWKGKKVRTILALCDLLVNESVETERQFASWLSGSENLKKLLAISGVGPKSIDYAKILVGIDTAAVDVHVRAFVARAGLPNADYEKTRALINDTADLMGVRRSVLDYAIWEYMAG